MTEKIKLNAASGGGSVSLQAPSSSSNNRVFTIPDVADAVMATVNGISEFDHWYLTSDVTADGDITSNLSRNDKTGAPSQIGTGMSQSSGVFTFPSTGKYLVIVSVEYGLNGSDNVNFRTQVTTNNSSYSNQGRAIDGNNGSGVRSGNATSFSFIDVTDTSQVKVKFNVSSITAGSTVKGDATDISTSFVFVRLGNT